MALLLSFIEQKMQAHLLKYLPTKRHRGILLTPVGEDSALCALFADVMLTQANAVTNHLNTAVKRIAKPVAIIGEALPSLSQLVKTGGAALMIQSGETTMAVRALMDSGRVADAITSTEGQR